MNNIDELIVGLIIGVLLILAFVYRATILRADDERLKYLIKTSFKEVGNGSIDYVPGSAKVKDITILSISDTAVKAKIVYQVNGVQATYIGDYTKTPVCLFGNCINF